MIRISKLTYDGLIENLTFTFAGNRPTRVDDAVAASAYGGGFEFKDAVKQVQSIWLLSFKSIETFIAAIILLLISFLGIVIKSNTYNIIFLGICFLYSVALGLIMFLLFLFFELPMIYILIPIMNFIVLVYMLRKYGRR